MAPCVDGPPVWMPPRVVAPRVDGPPPRVDGLAVYLYTWSLQAILTVALDKNRWQRPLTLKPYTTARTFAAVRVAYVDDEGKPRNP